MLKVAYAEPGAEVEFVLETPFGERANPTVVLEKGKTMGGYKYYLKNSRTYQSNLTGYVQYLGRPCWTWVAGPKDPTARTGVYFSEITSAGWRVASTTYVTRVPMGGASDVEIFTYYKSPEPSPPPAANICHCWDPNFTLPPSPPPPPPPPPSPPPPRSEDCCRQKTESYTRPDGILHRAVSCYRCCNS